VLTELEEVFRGNGIGITLQQNNEWSGIYYSSEFNDRNLLYVLP